MDPFLREVANWIAAKITGTIMANHLTSFVR